MNFIYLVLTYLIFLKGFAGEQFLEKTGMPETFIDCCKAGIIENQDGKIHVPTNRFAMTQNGMAFLSETLKWIPINELIRDILGVATIEDYREECKIGQSCLRKHVGFYWSPKWNLWFCLNKCPYNFYTNFPTGMGE
jgi:hypothetical protein